MEATATKVESKVGMKVLLIADPPMGDKVESRLKALSGVAVTYVRERSPAQMMSAITPGYDWVLVMNGHSAGVALKGRCATVGARYVAIPPSWSQAEALLRGQHFFRDMVAARPLTQPLPLNGIGSGAVRMVVDEAAKLPPYVLEAAAAHAVQHETKPEAPALEVSVEKATPATKPITDRELEGAALARRIFERNPDATGTDVWRTLRAAGYGIGADGRQKLYVIRREVREAAGLSPSGACGWHKKAPPARRAAPTEIHGPAKIEVVLPAPAPAAANDTGLPESIIAAAQLFAESMRDAGLQGWLRITDAGEVDGDVQIRRRLQVATRV